LEKVDSVREEALKILLKVFNEKSYSNILLKNMGQKYSPLDRAFITEIVYGTIKFALKIDYILAQLSKIKLNKVSPPILNILRMGVYQMGFMDKVPQSAAVNECVKLAKKYGNPGSVKYVNGVLRNYARIGDNIIYPDREKDFVHYLSVSYSYPEWIIQKILDGHTKDFTEDFLAVSNKVPHVNVRVNRLKADKDGLKESLIQKGIDVSAGSYLDDALILKEVPGIESLSEYNEGLFTVQDESSMLVCRVLSPESGDFIMDLCSAPGTKSTYIAEIMNNKGTIISGDISDRKLRLVEKNCRRLGIDIVSTLCHNAGEVMEKYRGRADKVLLDVPCSGLGIMRKKPEIRWNRYSEDIKSIENIQRLILEASSSYVKPGGCLVYSTCTILKSENIDIINDFVKRHSDFKMEDITGFMPDSLKKDSCSDGYVELYPNVDNVDGFFISKLRRVI
jgi:ribosomal RNA small subunit methyltransferase RsmB